VPDTRGCWTKVFAKSAPASPSSRYQLVPAQVDSLTGGTVQHTVFLLDTQTGKVWKYVASGQPKTLKEKDQTTDPARQSV
jgi:hypothetical protein